MDTIFVINKSSVLSPTDFGDMVQACQGQLDLDFSRAWGLSVKLQPIQWTPSTAPTVGWQIIVADNSDQAGDLGYHNEVGTTPRGFVFVGDCQKYGIPPSVTFSHEVLEMLVDPWINAVALMPDNRVCAYEVCDPVEDDRWAYQNGGSMLVSNFVYPSWFTPGSEGPWDQLHSLTGPFQMSRGGYMMIYDKGNWSSSFEASSDTSNAQSVRRDKGAFSRSFRRTM